MLGSNWKRFSGYRNKPLQRYLNITLTQKLIGIVVLFFLIPLLIISLVVFINVYHTTLKSESNLRNTILTSTQRKVDSTLAEYEKIVNLFYDYPNILNLYKKQDRPSASLDKTHQLPVVLGRMRKSQEFVASLGLLFPDFSLAYSTSGYVPYQVMEQYNKQHFPDYLRQLDRHENTAKWLIGIPPTNQSKPTLVYSKPVRNIYDKNSPIGVIIMHISVSALDSIDLLENSSEPDMLVLSDENGNVIWHSDNVLDDSMFLQNVFIKQAMQHANSGQLTPYSTKEGMYYYFSKYSKASGLHYTMIAPKAQVYRQIYAFLHFFILVLLLLVVFFALCVFLLNGNIIRPIQKLIVFMENINELNNLEHSLPVASSDEIGILYQTFNRMNQRTNSLVEKLEEAHLVDKEKTIKLLQSQLNPHFIYNTLESISWETYDRGMPEVSLALENLSQILRYSVKYSSSYVTFRQEIQALKSYVFIQRFRFEDRFAIEFDVDCSLLDYNTEKFVMQPFVENALLHGLKDKQQGGRITVTLDEKDNDIVLTIQDNGCGMSPQKLENLRTIHATRGIGIHNIDQTLRLRYGKQYGVSVASELDIGTTVTVRIPKLPQDLNSWSGTQHD